MRVGKLPVKGGDVDFPGSPVVKTPHFHCTGHRFTGSPGQRSKIPHAVWYNQKKNYFSLKKRGSREMHLSTRAFRVHLGVWLQEQA